MFSKTNKLRIIFAAIAIFAACFCLYYLTSSNKPEHFAGKTMKGTAPWGAVISVSIDRVDDGTVDWSYREEAADHFRKITFHPQNDIIKDGEAAFDYSGIWDDPDFEQEFQYSGVLRFKRGHLELTFTDGHKTVVYGDGQKDTVKIDSIPEEQRTVVLKP